MFSNTLPLAAMFLRNKILSWAALFTALQVYLNEPPVRGKDAQPAWITLVTSVIGLVTCYMDFVIPKRLPPPVAQRAAESVSTAVQAAVETAVSAAR
jgi:hypothetical protein